MNINKKIGRNDDCPCGARKLDGKPKKYKYCCESAVKTGEKHIVAYSRRDLINGPYLQCPQCYRRNVFGVFLTIQGCQSYTRECVLCGHQQDFSLPTIKKKILYLDQFVISNLVKLLDKDHKSHDKIKKNPFWEKLFIKLELASKAQAIVCPDSYFHINESLMGTVDFRLMKRLYEHFSSGKTLRSAEEIERIQIYNHFRNWLKGNKTVFNFNREEVARENLDSWSVGVGVSVNTRRSLEEKESLRASKNATEEQIKNIWIHWQAQQNFNFVEQVREETLALGKGLVKAELIYRQRFETINQKILSGQIDDLNINDLVPPASNRIFRDLLQAAREECVPEKEIPARVTQYLSDTDSLLEVPKIRISSVMFAGMARRAYLKTGNPPKSFVDVGFISSYLPYCDAMFVDIEARSLIKELPRERVPKKFKLDDFPTRIFSLRQQEEFLKYLDSVVADIPFDQLEAVKNIEGEDYGKPYWEILEHEKQNYKRVKDSI